MVDKRLNRSKKRDKPTITKKALERLVTIKNGAPINNISCSNSEEPEFTSSSSVLTSRPKDSTSVTTVKPAIQKPTFDFKALMNQSHIGSQLPGFLEQMKAANEELEVERRAGTLASRRIEIDDTSSEGETSSSDEDENDDDEEETKDGEKRRVFKEGNLEGRKKEKKERGQYIEMNLGLGVLEEKNSEDETSSSGSEDESEDEDMGVMDKLEGRDREDIEVRKKAKIEVVKET